MSEEQAIQSQDSSSDADASSSDEILDDVILEIDDYKGTRTFGGPMAVTEGMEEEEEGEVEDPDPKSKQTDGEEEEAPKKDGEDTGLTKQLRRVIHGLEKKIKTLEQKVAPPEEEKTEVKLTDEQLLAIMSEHEGDPQVMLNVMKYVQQQSAKDAADAMESSQKIKAITSQADTYLGQVFNGYGTEEFSTELDTHFPLEDWGLKNNPMRRQIQAALALASAFKPLLEEQVGRHAKEKAPDKKQIEDRRLDAISKRGGIPRSNRDFSSEGPAFSARSAQVVKDLGLTKGQQKLYATFLGSGRKKG